MSAIRNIICSFILSLVFFAALDANVLAEQFNRDSIVSYDITNDGVEDTVTFIRDGVDEDDRASAFKVTINGNEALVLDSSDPDIEFGYFSFEHKLVTIKGKNYLFIHLGGDNDDGPSKLYGYGDGRLKGLIDFTSMQRCRWIDSVKVKGNKLIVDMQDSGVSGLGLMTFRTIYSYKNGDFKLKSKEHKIMNYANMMTGNTEYTGKITTRRAFQLYSDKKGKKKSVYIPANVKVKAKRIYIDKKYCAVYIEGGKYKGWYTSKYFNKLNDSYYYDTGYIVDLFKEVGGVA